MKLSWISERGLVVPHDNPAGLARRVLQVGFPEVEDCAAAEGGVLVHLLPGHAPGAALLKLLQTAGPTVDTAPARLVEIPVRYGGSDGPDLAELAARAGMTEGAAVRLHSAAEYRVLFLGFQPGFAYLAGTPAVLAAPRLGTPRAQVPAGSLAIGGPYSGIYPGVSPGGWRIIGRTERVLFDAGREPDALLVPGDRVRFLPL